MDRRHELGIGLQGSSAPLNSGSRILGEHHRVGAVRMDPEVYRTLPQLSRLGGGYASAFEPRSQRGRRLDPVRRPETGRWKLPR